MGNQASSKGGPAVPPVRPESESQAAQASTTEEDVSLLLAMRDGEPLQQVSQWVYPLAQNSEHHF
jgi:hypothetical protein